MKEKQCYEKIGGGVRFEREEGWGGRGRRLEKGRRPEEGRGRLEEGGGRLGEGGGEKWKKMCKKTFTETLFRCFLPYF